MPAKKSSAPVDNSRLLLLFADGGALQELNDRVRSEDSPIARVDFLKIPADATNALKRADDFAAVECPHQARVFFTLGSSTGASFQEKMSAEWTVETIPLGLCRYERAVGPEPSNRGPFRVRFHALLGYNIGYLAGKASSSSRPFTVGVISDDPHILPALADAQRRGIDARLMWFQNALPEEVGYFAARNHVKVVRIDLSRSDRLNSTHLDDLSALLR